MYVYHKERQNMNVLKELLQLMKVSSPSRTASFFYIESTNSHMAHLTLWENLQLVVGIDSWKEYLLVADPDHKSLLNLMARPHIKAAEADPWELFLVSLLKALAVPGLHLLVNMNEDELSPFMVQTFKNALVKAADQRHVYLATHTPALWLDCAHSLVKRKEYQFVVQELNEVLIRQHWLAS